MASEIVPFWRHAFPFLFTTTRARYDHPIRETVPRDTWKNILFRNNRVVCLQTLTTEKNTCILRLVAFQVRVSTTLRAFWLARLPCCADVCIASQAFAFPVNYFINEIYNLFPCKIALSRQAGSSENTSSFGKHEAQTEDRVIYHKIDRGQAADTHGTTYPFLYENWSSATNLHKFRCRFARS